MGAWLVGFIEGIGVCELVGGMVGAWLVGFLEGIAVCDLKLVSASVIETCSMA